MGILDIIAFFAVYAAGGNAITWNDFFVANFNRWSYLQEHFVTGLSWTVALGVAIFVGLAICALTAMIRAPYFRAVAGKGYPLAPKGALEATRLATLYLLTYLVLHVAPLVAPDNAVVGNIAGLAILVVVILIAFADYVIVYEQLPTLQALRRSVFLVRRKWYLVIVVIVIVQLIYYGLFRLYDSYYSATRGVFILLPISQILVEAFLVLVTDLILVFMYQQIRRGAV